MKIILITGARAPIALELARSFSAQGHRVIVADSQHLTLARWSNACHQYYVLPSPAFHEGAFIEILHRIIKTEHVDQLIPTCEEVFFISKHLESFKCEVWTSHLVLMNQLHNKELFIQVSKGILITPETAGAEDFSDWEHTENYVFKKKYSRFGTSVLVGQPAEKCLHVKKDAGDWIYQELLHGSEVCVYSLWDHGNLKAHVCYHPRYRLGRGAGIYFEHAVNEDILRAIESFGRQIKFHGQLCFDVILKEGIPYFIECNPRGTSGAHLLNKNLCFAFLNETLQKAEPGINFSIAYAMAFAHPLSFRHRQVRAAKDVIFSWHDPLPGLLQPLSIFEIAYIAFKKRISWLKASTEDIEWNGE